MTWLWVLVIPAGVVVMLLAALGLLMAAQRAKAWWTSRGEGDEAPVVRGLTVPPADGSHDDLPEDKRTDRLFWSIAKTAGIEADR